MSEMKQMRTLSVDPNNLFGGKYYEYDRKYQDSNGNTRTTKQKIFRQDTDDKYNRRMLKANPWMHKLVRMYLTHLKEMKEQFHQQGSIISS